MSGIGMRIEAVTKLAGAIAVLGFMSWRAHMNFIGIPSMLAMDVPTYLTEAYLLVAGVTIRVLVIVFCLTLVVLPLVLLWWLLRRTAFRAAISRLERNISSWCVSSPVGVLIVSLLLLSGVLALLNSLRGPWDIAVGPLVKPGLSDTDQLLLDLAIGGILLVTLWLRRALHLAGTRRKSVSSVARQVVYGLVLFASALVPVLHGHGVRPAMYPEVTLETKEGGRACGLLVSSTADDYVIWVPKRAAESIIGTMEVFPRDGTRRLESGQLRDLATLIVMLVNPDRKDSVICGL